MACGKQNPAKRYVTNPKTGARELKGALVRRKTCPVCGSGMIAVPACAHLSRRGWATMLICVKAGCGKKRGYERKTT